MSAIGSSPARESFASASSHDRGLQPGDLPYELRSALIGFAAAAFAVAVRATLPLPAIVLPFFTAVIAICVVTATRGLVAGAAATILGGLLSWYYVLSPGSWVLGQAELVSLLGYFAIAIVILATAELYRRAERRRERAVIAIAAQEVQQQRFFAAEMSHRLKNAMALVQALASQTFAKDTPDLAKFEGRLKALADAHTLLMDHAEQPTASIRAVVAAAISAFDSDGQRVRCKGPDFELPAQQVVSLALALHELATNAVKHGALSTTPGWVSVEWQKLEGNLRLVWSEHDGPSVSEPARSGFGTQLLKRAAIGADLLFDPHGLRCIITQSIR